MFGMKKLGSKIFASLMLVGLVLAANAQDLEKEIKDFQTKYPTSIDVRGKILNLDPIKGDMTVRLEFFPSDDLMKDDGTLAKTIKFDTDSANGKSEVVFEKGKRMNPTEVVLGMYGEKKEGSTYVSVVEDYPYDSHRTDLYLYFLSKPDKKKDAPKPAEGDAEVKKEDDSAEDGEEEIPHLLTFAPSSPGYTLIAAKNKDNDEGYTSLNIAVSRSTTVKLFSTFIMVLMWSVSLAVLALVFTVVFKGRKSELAMFSFIATLLFAFVTVRNSQPGVPPVGTFSDQYSFFWAEAILGICLLAVVLTWVFRKPA